jgi:hypothetical protein
VTKKRNVDGQQRHSNLALASPFGLRLVRLQDSARVLLPFGPLLTHLLLLPAHAHCLRLARRRHRSRRRYKLKILFCTGMAVMSRYAQSAAV